MPQCIIHASLTFPLKASRVEVSLLMHALLSILKCSTARYRRIQDLQVKTKKKQKIVPDNNNNVGAESQGVDDITVGKDAPGKANGKSAT